MNDIKIKYSSPARPPIKIDIDKVYTVIEIKNKFNINDDFIKDMFSPIGATWEKIEGKSRKIKFEKADESTTEGE